MTFKSTKPHPFARKYPRITGLAVFFIGFGIFYFSIVEPTLHARVGEAVKLSGKGGLGGMLLALVGLAFVAFGPRLMEWNNSSAGKSPKLALILGSIFAAVSVVAIELFKAHLRSKGYVL